MNAYFDILMVLAGKDPEVGEQHRGWCFHIYTGYTCTGYVYTMPTCELHWVK